jgi:hypothetical protein
MPEWRPRRYPGAAGGLADADGFGAALADQLQCGVDQDPAEVAVVIGLWRRGAAARLGGRDLPGGGDLGRGSSGSETHGFFPKIAKTTPCKVEMGPRTIRDRKI